MHTFITVYFCRYVIHSSMISAILFVTPDQCIAVQICNISKCSSDNKIFFYKADKPFHLSLCKGVSAFTQLCMETDCFHEDLIIFLPYWISFHISSDYHAFHIICKNVFWNAHVNKRMNHTNEQIFLSGIRKEFNVALAAVMTDHGETCTLIRSTFRSIYFNKSPVHLIILTRTCMISSASVSL